MGDSSSSDSDDNDTHQLDSVFCIPCRDSKSRRPKFSCIQEQRLPIEYMHLLEENKLGLSQLTSLYTRFLKASDGHLLSFLQFQNGLGILGMLDDTFLCERLFQAFDTNQDGKLDFEEYSRGLGIMMKGSENAKLDLAFRICCPTKTTIIEHDSDSEVDTLSHGQNSIKEECLCFEDFSLVVTSLARTRAQLLGPVATDLPQDLCARVFAACSSVGPNGTRYMSKTDFKEAVYSSPDFLRLLGLYVLPLSSKTLNHHNESIMSSVIQNNPVLVANPNERKVKFEERGSPLTEASRLEETIDQLRSILATLEAPTSVRSTLTVDLTPKETAPVGERLESMENQLKTARARTVNLIASLQAEKEIHPAFSRSSDESGVSLFHEISSNLSFHSGVSSWNSGKHYEPDVRWNSMFVNRPKVVRTGKQKLKVRTRPEAKLLKNAPGFRVYFGHESWNMVLNMMVGIRLAAARSMAEPSRSIEAYDYVMKEKFSILPRSRRLANTKETYEAVRFIDYAPMVFRKIREFFKVDPENYLRSVGPEQLVANLVLGNLSSLSELGSEGKSGAFFYYSADGRYIIKTLEKKAAKFLREILHQYYEHITSSAATLITRFYGLHAIRLKREGKLGPQGDRLHFVVLHNVFFAPVELHRRYDLKGSTVGRVTPDAFQKNSKVTLKDNDFVNAKERLRISLEHKNRIMTVIHRDCSFFRMCRILDYSLLVGIHDTNKNDETESVCESAVLDPSSHRQPSSIDSELSASKSKVSEEDVSCLPSSDGNFLYYLGIVDVLTPWSPVKLAEHALFRVKTLSSQGMSCVHPDTYATRFSKFIGSCCDTI